MELCYKTIRYDTPSHMKTTIWHVFLSTVPFAVFSVGSSDIRQLSILSYLRHSLQFSIGCSDIRQCTCIIIQDTVSTKPTRYTLIRYRFHIELVQVPALCQNRLLLILSRECENLHGAHPGSLENSPFSFCSFVSALKRPTVKTLKCASYSLGIIILLFFLIVKSK